jgi:hypothetical protein
MMDHPKEDQITVSKLFEVVSNPQKNRRTHGKTQVKLPNFSGSFSWIHHGFKMFFMTC